MELIGSINCIALFYNQVIGPISIFSISGIHDFYSSASLTAIHFYQVYKSNFSSTPALQYSITPALTCQKLISY